MFFTERITVEQGEMFHQSLRFKPVRANFSRRGREKEGGRKCLNCPNFPLNRLNFEHMWAEPSESRQFSRSMVMHAWSDETHEVSTWLPAGLCQLMLRAEWSSSCTLWHSSADEGRMLILDQVAYIGWCWMEGQSMFTQCPIADAIIGPIAHAAPIGRLQTPHGTWKVTHHVALSCC